MLAGIARKEQAIFRVQIVWEVPSENMVTDGRQVITGAPYGIVNDGTWTTIQATGNIPEPATMSLLAIGALAANKMDRSCVAPAARDTATSSPSPLGGRTSHCPKGIPGSCLS
ncbi:MAG: PEP-CTERM sorting domain-containing protein [Planctomycetaceae bacterium]|nr:PEP-CTERM sorting domain-containing protein [Planctomycetaceae bacterium]